MANFILTTHWTTGEVLPLIRLGACLKQRGHEVRILTHCHYSELARQAGLSFTAWDTPEEWAQLLDDNKQTGNPLGNPAGIERFHRKHQTTKKCLAEYEKVIRHCGAPDTVIVARHLTSTAAFLAAEKLCLPLVATFVAPSFLRQIAIDEEVFGDILLTDLNLVRDAIGLPQVRRWRDWASSPRRSLGLWPEWFAPAESDWPLRVIPVGFPAPNREEAELPIEVRALLGKDAGTVLIFGGTGKQLHPGFYSASIEACRRLNRRCLVVTPHPDLLPRGLPENVTWFEHLPFANLMPHVAAIIHHGGVGTLSQALAAGKPQLVLPDYYDRPANAVYLKQLGVAEYIPPARWEPEAVTNALACLFTSERLQRCREYAERMSSTQFATNVCAHLEPVVSNPDFVMPGPASHGLPSAVSSLRGRADPTHSENLDSATAKVTGARRTLLIRWLREKQAPVSTPTGDDSGTSDSTQNEATTP